MDLMVTHEELAARVKLGAEALDREQPEWFREISSDLLDLNSCVSCVLGQVFGDYRDVLVEWGWGKLDAERHGFYLPFSPNDDDDSLPYSDYPDLILDLKLLWFAAIEHRIDAA